MGGDGVVVVVYVQARAPGCDGAVRVLLGQQEEQYYGNAPSGALVLVSSVLAGEMNCQIFWCWTPALYLLTRSVVLSADFRHGTFNCES
jgi:hypothetical protein